MSRLDRYLGIALVKPFLAVLGPLVLISPWLLATHQADMLVSGVSVSAWFAASFAFSRLVRDGEIGALRAHGASLSRLLRAPVILVAGVATFVTVGASVAESSAPSALRISQILLSVLVAATALPLAVRFAKRDAYLPGGIALGAMIAFDLAVGIAWTTASGPYQGSFGIAVLDAAAAIATIWFVRRAEWK